MKLLIVLALARASLAIPMGVSEVSSANVPHSSMVTSHADAATPSVANIPFPYKTFVSPLTYTPGGFSADAPQISAANVAQFAGNINLGSNPWAKLYNPYLSSFAVNHGGYLADNPDAVIANAAHLAEQAKVIKLAASIYPGLFASSPEVTSTNDNHFAEYVKALGFPAAFPVGGVTPDAQQVALAKAAHFGEQANFDNIPFTTKFVNPLVAPVTFNHANYLADNPEAVIAKAAQIAQLAKAAKLAAAVPYSGFFPYSPEFALAKAAYFAATNGASGAFPAAGVIPESPAVALAKAAHFAEHAKASAIANAIVDHYPVASSFPVQWGYTPVTPDVSASKVDNQPSKSDIGVSDH